jgi:TPR repeat protein
MIWRSFVAAFLFISLPSAAFAQIEPDLLADAERGDAETQFNLGFMYSTGKGVPENDIEAVKWYRLAAEQGAARAQYNLGVMYEKGKGVPSNGIEAVKWYRLAAKQGLTQAQYNLGNMYYYGNGVTTNYVKAYAWWSMAAAQGNEDASANKDIVTDRMTREQIADAQAYAARCFENDYKGCD